MSGTAMQGRASRRAAAAVLGIVILASLGATAPRAGAGATNLEQVARLPLVADPFPTSPVRGRLLFDRERRIGFRLFADPDTSSLAIWAFDLDTLEPGARKIHPSFSANNSEKYGFFAALGGGRIYAIDEVGWVHAFDEMTLEEVGLYPSILPPPSGSIVAVASRERAEGNRRTTEGGRRTPVHPFPALPGHRILAFEYVPSLSGSGGGELLTLSHGYVNEVDVPVSFVVLHRWNAATGREIGITRLDGCRSGRGFGNDTRASTGLALTRQGDGTFELLYGCVGRGLVGEVWKARLHHDGTVTEQQRVAEIATASDFMFDPAGRRAHALTSAGSGQSLVAVDLDRGGVVGAVGLSYEFEATAAPGGVGAAVDPTTGRVYALGGPSEQGSTGKTSPGGLVLVDGRRSPLPQGFAFTDLSRPAVEMIAIDPAAGSRPTRLFVRRLGEPFYRIFADRIPVERDPGLADADRFTANTPERAGRTAAAFTGGGSGYGMRMLLVGGFSAVPDPVAFARGSSVTKDLVPGYTAEPACGPTNRELVIATVSPNTGLSDTAATAEAAAATADPRTVQDLARPIASCSPSLLGRTTLGRSRTHPDDFTGGTNAFESTKVPGSDKNVDQFLGPAWPFSPAVCLPPQRPVDESPHEGDGAYANTPPPPGWKARTSCDVAQQEVTADATASAIDLAGVRATAAETTTSLTRDLGKGVTVTVRSTVRGLRLADVASVDEVRSEAVSAAAGRPGTALTTFTTEVCGLSIPTLSVDGCFDPRSPESRQIVAALNQALAQRQMEIRLPMPDHDLRAGTPGGALAAVQKDRFATEGEQLFNNDFLTAVPALEVIRIHDSTLGRGRQIVQIAGVQASTAYNVSVVPTGTGPRPGGGHRPGAGQPGPAVLPKTITPGPAAGTATPDAGGFPTPPQLLATIVSTISYVLRYAFRRPGDALSVIALLAVAFALPLHLLERRRAFVDALSRRS